MKCFISVFMLGAVLALGTEPVLNGRSYSAVRSKGSDGVHTYRIPGLTQSVKGTLLAIYDVRRDSSRDLQGDIDIGLSRSLDGGKSWEPMQIIMDMGEWGGKPQSLNGCSDACILVDRKSGSIFVASSMKGVRRT